MSTTFKNYPISLSELRGKGPEYLVHCPFHDDRHESLSINLEKGVYHCFGCEASGRASEIVEGLEGEFVAKTVVRNGPILSRDHYEQPSQIASQWLERTDVGDTLQQIGQDIQSIRYKACGVVYDKYRCEKCGAPIARAHFCDLPYCEDCRRRHRRRFFEKHKARLEKGEGTYQVFGFMKVRVPVGQLRNGFKMLVERFKQMRKVVGGISGIASPVMRKVDGYWEIWLEVMMKSNEQKYIELAMLTATGLGIAIENHKRFEELSEAWSYFSFKSEFRLEFESIEELAEIVLDLKHVKWFYGFGEYFKVSGWKGEKKRAELKCPLCGGHLKRLGTTRDAFVFWDEEEGIALWSEREVVKW